MDERERRGDLVAGGRNGKHGSYRDERESLFMGNDTKTRAMPRAVGSQWRIFWFSEKVKQRYHYRVDK